ncbi:MAG: Gfo/Idh/MocA family oxidoreductase [Thermaurantimonas sp.]
MKRFALIGAAGYIAPRHMKAIKETDNDLIAAYDPYDGVGIIDSYFPHASFFVEFERFDRHIDKLRRVKRNIDFVSICSPNYLHDSHIRFSLKIGADVICEKPIVLNPWNLAALEEIERESGKKVYNVLQLRLHKSVLDLKRKVESELKEAKKRFSVELTYITSRGKWYYTSWKGDLQKSGGIATNIGIHFFDMLTWIFGSKKSQVVHLSTHDRASGIIELENADVKWFLSINEECLPDEVRQSGKKTFRSLKIDEEEYEFSDGFNDLHTATYRDIMNGGGFGLNETKQAIEIVYEIRNSAPVGLKGEYHPLSKLPLSKHPFQI